MSDEPQFVDFKCPHCQETVSFPETASGTAHECPNCLETLVIPAEPKEFADRVPVPIQTPRLILRRLEAGDYQDLKEFIFDKEMFRYIPADPQDEESILKWLEADRFVKLTSQNATFTLGIQLQADPKLIGLIYLRLTEDGSQATLQVNVSLTLQRQGFGTEATDAVLGF